MEMLAIAVSIVVVTILFVWRKSIKRIAQYSEDMITVNASEGQLELTERANSIIERLDGIGDYRVSDLDEAFASKGVTNKTKATGKK